MDVAPHPHIGLQTVSWLLEGEVIHHDSLGLDGPAGPGVLNLMTAGRGIAHAEETPPANGGRLRGVQLWVALPDGEPATRRRRSSAPRRFPWSPLPGGRATVIIGALGGVRSPARAFSPMVGAEVSGEPAAPGVCRSTPRSSTPSCRSRAACALDGQPLAVDTLYYLGLRPQRARARARAGAVPRAAHRRRALRRDDPDVVELRGPDARRDRGRARGLAGRPPLRRGEGLRRSAPARAAVSRAARGRLRKAQLNGCSFVDPGLKMQPGGCACPSDADRIEKEIVVRAPRSRVWRALTDAREFGQWFEAAMEGPFAPGALARDASPTPGTSTS